MGSSHFELAGGTGEVTAMANDVLIYGSYGYTGNLIVRMSEEWGIRPILAGRSGDKLRTQAAEFGLDSREFSLDEPEAVDEGLRDCAVVVHCAGPFAHTSKAMADGCLRNGVHYLDVTGEVEVFEALAARDDEAKNAGVMLLPGAGFDVAPTDCMAAYLKQKLPSATSLTLAFQGLGGVSRGTATTMVENIGQGGLIRKNGELTSVPAAWKTRWIDFGEVPIECVTIPWGDVSTAYYSTGIPNIEVYMAAPAGLRRFMKVSRFIGPILETAPVQFLMKRAIKSQPPGPTDEERARGESRVFGEVTDDAGNAVEARMVTPEGYTLTAKTALAMAKKVVDGQAPAGFQTPSKAYGADFVLEIEGVVRSD